MKALFSHRLVVFGICLLCSMLARAANISPITVLQVDTVGDGSGNIVVQGTVDSSVGVASFDLNGYPVSNFDGQSFTVQVPAASDYEFGIYGLDGSYQQVVYADALEPVHSAIQVVVGDQLMRDVGPAMGRLLSDLDLNSALGIDPNTCVIDTWLLRGCDMYIKQLALVGTPDIQLYFSPTDGQQLDINIAINIPQAVLSTKLKRAFWWGYRSTTVTTHDIRLIMQLGAQATPNQSIRLILDEPSDIQMYLGDMKISSNTIAAYMVPLLKDPLALFIKKHLVNIVGPFLAKLPIPSIPLALPMDIDGDGVTDAEFAMVMGAELLDVLPSGDGVAEITGSISSTMVAPGRQTLGTRRIASVAPDAQILGGATDLSAAVSTNFVNQVLGAVYQSGIEEKITVPVKVSDLGSFGSTFVGLGLAALDDQLNISLSFGAPPELQVNDDSLYPLGIAMAMPRLRVVMDLVTPEGTQLFLDMTADIDVSTSLGADSSGKLYLELNELLAMNNVSIDGGRLAEGGGGAFIEGLIGTAIPALVTEFEPMITDLLNAARLDLDIGVMLSSWLRTTFPSVPVSAYVTETGVNDDESYMEIGMGIDFP